MMYYIVCRLDEKGTKFFNRASYDLKEVSKFSFKDTGGRGLIEKEIPYRREKKYSIIAPLAYFN